MSEPLAVLTRAQLEELVDRAARRVIDEYTRAQLDEWMSAAEVAKLLGVKRSTIPSLVLQRGLPHYRPGKSYTFRRSEVLAWLEARRGNRPSGTLRALRGGRDDGE